MEKYYRDHPYRRPAERQDGFPPNEQCDYKTPWPNRKSNQRDLSSSGLLGDRPPVKRGILGDKPSALLRNPNPGIYPNHLMRRPQEFFSDTNHTNSHQPHSYKDPYNDFDYRPKNVHCIPPASQHDLSSTAPSHPLSHGFREKNFRPTPFVLPNGSLKSSPSPHHHHHATSQKPLMPSSSSGPPPKNSYSSHTSNSAHYPKYYTSPQNSWQRHDPPKRPPYNGKPLINSHLALSPHVPLQSSHQHSHSTDSSQGKSGEVRKRTETTNGLYPQKFRRDVPPTSTCDESQSVKQPPHRPPLLSLPSTSKEKSNIHHSQPHELSESSKSSENDSKSSQFTSLRQPEKSIVNLLSKLYPDYSETNGVSQQGSTHRVSSQSCDKLVKNTKGTQKEVSEKANNIVMRCEKQQSRTVISSSNPLIQKRISKDIETKSILQVGKSIGDTSIRKEVCSEEVIDVQISSSASKSKGQSFINASRKVKSSCSSVWKFSNSGSPHKISEQKSKSISVTQYSKQPGDGNSKDETHPAERRQHASKTSTNRQIKTASDNSNIVTRSKVLVPFTGHQTRSSCPKSIINMNKLEYKNQNVKNDVSKKFKLKKFIAAAKNKNGCRPYEISHVRQQKISPSNRKPSLKNKITVQKQMRREVHPKETISAKSKLKSKGSANVQNKIRASQQLAVKSKIYTSKIKKATSCIKRVEKAKKTCTNSQSKPLQSATISKPVKKKKKPFRGGRYQLYLHGRPKKKVKKTPSPQSAKQHARKSITMDFKCVSHKKPSSNSFQSSVEAVSDLQLDGDFTTKRCRKTCVKNALSNKALNENSVAPDTESSVTKVGHGRKTIVNGYKYSNCTVNVSDNGVTKNMHRAAFKSSTTTEDDGTKRNLTVASQQFSTTWTRREPKFVCNCLLKPERHNTKSRVTCRANDSIDGKNIKCARRPPFIYSARPSHKLEFIEMCDMHIMRLRCHECCPLCGIFCIQGTFLVCRSAQLISKDNKAHYFHKNCVKERKCPHCWKSDYIENVKLTLNKLAKCNGRRASNSFPSSTRVKGRETISRTISCASLKSNKLHSEATSASSSCSERHLTRDRCDKRSMKHYFYALKQGNVLRVYEYLKDGASVGYKFDHDVNNTPLHVAATFGHMNCVKLLVQAGAALDSFNDSMLTPLMCALEMQHFEIAKYMINSKASVIYSSILGRTPLHSAAKAGDLKMCKLIYSKNKFQLNAQDSGGWTPLVWACEHSHFKVVRWLLQVNASHLIYDNEGNVALHWAAFSGVQSICELLLDVSCDVDLQNAVGDTPLHIATRKGNYECVLLFLKRGANARLRNLENQTPIMDCDDEDLQTYKVLQWYGEMTDFHMQLISKENREVLHDVSRGREPFPVPVINDINDEIYIQDFQYLTKVLENEMIVIDKSICPLRPCACEGKCSNCDCVTKLNPAEDDPNFSYGTEAVFECQRICTCHFSCPNRASKHGVQTSLQVFRTKFKGWGLRTVNGIPKGTFVCEFVGELVEAETAKKQDDSYMFELSEDFFIDASKYGNIARFINHSCYPNLVPIKLFSDYTDCRFPSVAFFTLRDLVPKEELTYNYGAKFWGSQYRTRLCMCMSNICIFNTMTIQSSVDAAIDIENADGEKSEMKEDCKIDVVDMSDAADMTTNESRVILIF